MAIAQDTGWSFHRLYANAPPLQRREATHAVIEGGQRTACVGALMAGWVAYEHAHNHDG
jgi:hypothetical protein